MTTPRKYRKKPVVVEAIQWDGTAEGAQAIAEFVTSEGGRTKFHPKGDLCGCYGNITASQSHMKVRHVGRYRTIVAGRWVVIGGDREHISTENDWGFANTYEPVEGGDS